MCTYVQFPVPGSKLDDLVSEAYDNVRLQVLFSAIRAKERLGLALETDIFDALLAQDNADDRSASRLERRNRCSTEHARAVGRPADFEPLARRWLTLPPVVRAVRALEAYDDAVDSEAEFDDADEDRSIALFEVAMDLLSRLDAEDLSAAIFASRSTASERNRTLGLAKDWDASFRAHGGTVNSSWLEDILRDSPAETFERTINAVGRMGSSGFSGTFEHAAKWLCEHVLYQMPATVASALAFLEALARHGVHPENPAPDQLALAQRCDALPEYRKPKYRQEGAAALNWATAMHIVTAQRCMLAAMAVPPTFPVSQAPRLAPRSSI